MKSDTERCAEFDKFKQIDAAFRAGDLAALRAALDDPASLPNAPMPPMIGACLEYAIYHSPLPFIRTLLEIGADPSPADHACFPPLIAALSCSRPGNGSHGRPDVLEILNLLLSFRADPDLRGINDYTALHMAVSERNLPAVELLLQAGADPCLRTRDCEPATVKRRARWQRRRAFARSLNCSRSRRRGWESESALMSYI